MTPKDDERTIHRLEAFSDIVIGFCLAELGLNLVIPKDLGGLTSSWLSLNAFAISFVAIAILWWYHHRLFMTYLRLNGATIVMNFTLLAALIFGIHFQQVAFHFMADGVDALVPLRLWMICLALIYALLAAMYALCVWERRRDLDPGALRWGVGTTYQTGLSALGLAALCFTLPHNWMAAVLIVFVVTLAVSLQGLVVSRLTRGAGH
ncbi:MAG TPA: TMEM175 family protein [Candidatus Eremiobacteraceae bacterium]|nr:TMEM175 family protein [Candidatus Eremiobacteraceae bacterium]